MIGCCYCAKKRFRFENNEVDPARLELALESLKNKNANTPADVKKWTEKVLACSCLCHVDGKHIVRC